MNMIDRMEKSCAQVVCAGVAILAASLAQGGTVAYWPMVMDPETGGNTRTIADESGNGYTLKVNLSDAQVANTSEGAFSRPPNGPAGITASSCVDVVNNGGTVLRTVPFSRGDGSQSQTSDPMILAMGLRHDFTIEGYMYVKSLKHVPVPADAETIIAISGITGTGDWMWYMLEEAKDSNTRKVIVKPVSGSVAENSGVLAIIDDDEIIGGWHHYALVFKFNEANSKSRWTFYLDGVNRGSQLMPNHAENVQHNRFYLGGATSGNPKEFDAKFAFWRVSDEALSADSLLCHQTFATTVAYWPMNVVSSLYDNVSQPIVPDVVDERNTLMIRDPSKGGVSWTDNDIGWTTPPNPDAALAAAGVSCPSKTMVRSGNNTTQIGNQYKQVFSTVTNAPVIEATKLNKSFTIEGFLKFTTLPADSSKNQMFIYNTLGERGGWVWNLLGADGNGFLTMRVETVNNGSSRSNRYLFNRFRAEELLNVWNHYALTFTPDNGRGQTEWRFYFNGHLLGVNNDMPAYGDYDFTAPKFFMSGCGSGTPQSLCGDMTCWRVSNKVLTSSELLCGGETPPVVPADALVWKGAADSAEWSTGGALNWIASGAPVSWTDAKDAYFDDNYVTNRIEITGEINPASINAIANSYMRLDFNKSRSSAIGTSCTNFVKRGVGIFEIYYGGSTSTNLMKGACPIEVREGCLRVNAVNSNGALGDASLGYEVKVYDHAELNLYGRNAIGSGSSGDVNASVFTVYTNGTFSMSRGDSFNIQALGALDLLGGNFVAPERCHAVGYLLIRDRLTLGCNPNSSPYVFPIVRNEGNTGDVQAGITFGYNTEFRVEDVTGDAAADGIFNCAVLARLSGNWQDAGHPCGFRKTGGGTMELNNPYGGLSGNHAKPTGVIAVEAGELKINIDYSTASKYTVADGAFLAGTGKVSRVEFAAGAGLRVDATKADLLELTGADFAGGGVIELSGVAVSENMRVNCVKVGDPVTGTANLSSWKVKVDGEEIPRLAVRVRGDYLVAGVMKGFSIIYK